MYSYSKYIFSFRDQDSGCHFQSPSCEICVTECCTVVQSTAIAMDVPPVSINSFSYLQTKWRIPKAGVTGSNLAARSAAFVPTSAKRDDKRAA
jgi:hypothetical protein